MQGFYQSTRSASFCSICETRTYASSPGSPACAPCTLPGLLALPSTFDRLCTDFVTDSRRNCTKFQCKKGSQPVDRQQGTQCESCPAGYFANQDGATACSKLESFVAFGDGSVAALCSAGRYSNVNGSTNCLSCSTVGLSCNNGLVPLFSCCQSDPVLGERCSRLLDFGFGPDHRAALNIRLPAWLLSRLHCRQRQLRSWP